MAIPTSLSSFPILILLLLFISSHGSEKQHVHGAAMVTNSHWHMIERRSLIPGSTRNPPSKAGSAPSVFRRVPGLPLHHKRLQPRLLEDQSRVNSIRESLETSGDGRGLRMPITSTDAGEYAVTVHLGTPGLDLPLAFDTGSSITWARCLPCPTQDCCPQNDHCFDSSSSTSYSKPPCSLPTCNYSISYADKSFSNGYYVQDTLTLSPDYQFPNFMFGCAQDISSGFGSYSGILGLAKGDHSFIALTQNKFASVFCYCIPPKDSSQGYLLFGMEALENCQTEQSTEILQDPSNYFVKLLGFTIGNKMLDFSELAPSSSPSRTIIDSGTTIGRLPPSFYSALRDEFKRQMSEYPPAPSLPSLHLDTCYNLEGHESVALPMVLNFDGVNVKLDPSGAVWWEKDSQVCLAFAANANEGDQIIIGSTQQRNLSILYNILDNKVEFGTGSCGN